MNARVALQPGRRLAKRYRLDRPAGSHQWFAHDEVLARPVLIAFAGAVDEVGVKGFRADALALARISHPHIVATYDTGVDTDGTVFRVDELMDAAPLGGMRNAGTLTPARVVSSIGQVAKALEHAHSHGLAHGNLSGNDVLVTDDDRVKLSGLGIAGPERDPARDLPALLQLFAELGPAAGGTPAALAARWAEGAAPATAVELRRALLSLETGPDDATPMTSAHPTPPHGVLLRRRPRWVPLVALTLLAAAALAVAGSLIGRDNAPDSANAPGGSITITAASFDPEATPAEENEEAVGNVVDGDPSTTWGTERYRSRPFAGLKDGVGLILRTGSGTTVTRLTVESPSEDWAAEIYVAERSSPTLAGWGDPITRQAGIRGDATFDLAEARGGAVLVWITDTGTARRVAVREARLEGRR